MTIKVTINNRAVRPECVGITFAPLPLRERELDTWHERFLNWWSVYGDFENADVERQPARRLRAELRLDAAIAEVVDAA